MPKVRKKPCRICRRWFQPDARVGDRQRACGKLECQTTRRQKTQSDWRKRNPDYGIAWRLDQRAAQTPAPEALRLPEPLGQLPWNAAKDQFSPYLPDPTGLPSRLPLFPKKTSSSLPHTESRADDDATGVSPTGPAMGAFASARAAPAAPITGVVG